MLLLTHVTKTLPGIKARCVEEGDGGLGCSSLGDYFQRWHGLSQRVSLVLTLLLPKACSTALHNTLYKTRSARDKINPCLSRSLEICVIAVAKTTEDEHEWKILETNVGEVEGG